MRVRPSISAWTSRIVLPLVLGLAGAWLAIGSSQVTAQTQAKMEATIFAYVGQDFVRTQTTLLTEAGESAVNTKLDRKTPAYEALLQKHSYTGDATIFGHKYESYYAPLTGEDGRLTGALFVGVPK